MLWTLLWKSHILPIRVLQFDCFYARNRVRLFQDSIPKCLKVTILPFKKGDVCNQTSPFLSRGPPSITRLSVIYGFDCYLRTALLSYNGRINREQSSEFPQNLRTPRDSRSHFDLLAILLRKKKGEGVGSWKGDCTRPSGMSQNSKVILYLIGGDELICTSEG